MSSFYTLLKQSILDRGISDADDREDIYAQAREAVMRKLERHDPPLGEDEIESRIEAFDVAVTEIESELLAVFAADRAPAREADDETRASHAETDVPEDRHDDADADDHQAQSRIVAIARYREALQSAVGPDDDTNDRPAVADEYDRTASFADDDRAYWRGNPQTLEREEYRDDPHGGAYAEDAAYGEGEAYAEGGLYADDRGYGYEGAHDDGAYDRGDDDDEISRAAARRDRWSSDDDGAPHGRAETAATATGRRLSEQNQVRILIGAIGFLALALVGFVVYMLMPVNTSDETDPIAEVIADSETVRREVSDAATAARIPAEDLAVAQSFVVFDGLDPTVFDASPSNPVLFDRDDGGGFARVSSGTGATGVRVLIGPGLASRLAGRRIRVILVARASPENGAASMRFAYQSGLAISHWQTANLSSGYAPLGLLWRVPTLRTDEDGDVLLIEPGIPGDGTAMDIQSIRIDLLAQ